MARKPDIQYIHPYSYGNTARKLDFFPQSKKALYELPEEKPQRARKAEQIFEPISVIATVIAAAMLITLMVGLFQLAEEAGRNQQLNVYLETLRKQGADLHMAYENAYDLQQVEERAVQMGLVYSSEVEHATLTLETLSTQQEPSFRERCSAFFAELFAKAPA